MPVRESDAFVMATGPRLFLGFTLVVLAAALTLLWQAFGPRSTPPSLSTASSPAERVTAAPTVAAPLPRSGEEPPVRSVYPGLGPSAPRPSEPVVSIAPAQPAAPPSTEPQPGELQPPAPPPALPAPVPDAAQSNAELPVGEAIDLNSASVDQLNELGAGMIGRHIVANRPYASPDELLSRRILNRRDFDAIRPRVVAR